MKSIARAIVLTFSLAVLASCATTRAVTVPESFSSAAEARAFARANYLGFSPVFQAHDGWGPGVRVNIEYRLIRLPGYEFLSVKVINISSRVQRYWNSGRHRPYTFISASVIREDVRWQFRCQFLNDQIGGDASERSDSPQSERLSPGLYFFEVDCS